jgi:1-acyl-sn-glycerol-3-phosphate acyltransferase
MSRDPWIRLVLGLRSVLAGVWLLLSLLILVPIAGLALIVGRHHRLHDGFSIVWARGILSLLGIRVRCCGAERIERGEHYVVVVNHQSVLDIPALVVALQPHTPIRFVAKRSLFYLPILGWGMYLFGHIPMNRRGARQLLKGVLQAEKDVHSRWSVVFFPEGTRSCTGVMGAFKNGAFHTAARARARVLPVTIVGSWEKLPRQRWCAVSRGTIEVHVHPPVEPPRGDPQTVQAVADLCRRQIACPLLSRAVKAPGNATINPGRTPGAGDADLTVIPT